MERKQYPPNFYEPVISATIEKIVKPCNEKVNNDDATNENSLTRVNLMIQYWGLPTDNFMKQLKLSKAPIQPVSRLQKQKTSLPSLKPDVKEELRSSVVYKINCPGCHACYVGQTSPHMITHALKSTPNSKINLSKNNIFRIICKGVWTW